MANSLNDRGRVPEDFALDHMLLQLKRPAEQEQALNQFIDQLHKRGSANYHHWLTPAQFGQSFGPSQQDIDAVTSWLKSRGFTVNQIHSSGMLIDFSGTARQVRTALHTDIHYLNVGGEQHIANMSDPEIPEALAPVIAGVVSLHDFKPHTMHKRAKFTTTSGGGTYQALTPNDLATIYNLNPLFAAGITGKGQTIAVVEDTNLYSDADWSTFRTTFGLDQYSSGSLTTVHPSCTDPGIPRGAAAGDDGEAALDVEWASAAAPDAAIQLASCANTRTTFGGLMALVNMINSPNPPSVVSISYGNCEAENGEGSNAAFNSVYQQAVAEGMSVFVAAGDEGAASCDAGSSGATHGIGVSGWASTPYNVAVGGTDFSDSYNNTTNLYWNSTNNSTYGSALSYIPEIPWNDSCAGSLLASTFGFATSYGSSGFCGSREATQNQLLVVAAGSGGPSGCATGTPAESGIVGGTCQGYAKPSWQAGLAGIPNDGVRDIPDVSLFAGDGVWGHYYVTCWSDVRNGGAPCTGDPGGWAGAGGTSFSSPIMAGIQALVNQNAGGLQGNPNYVYYQLAQNGTSACDSSNGSTNSASCIFYNVTQGDIAVNCGGADNCFGATTTSTGRGRGSKASLNGALSTSGQSYAPAFGSGAGWNFATGIGSVNAYNLVMNWMGGGSQASQ
ncbi:MAG TPA: S53 family peptidase [Bryobacteraceae bacterium]|nr:S53 family peptidase [Bryobacteraceae bacterium]